MSRWNLVVGAVVQRYAQSMDSSGRSPRVSVFGGMYGSRAREGGKAGYSFNSSSSAGGGASFGSGTGGAGGGGGEMNIPANKKATMKDLNVRLATYLDKVKALEEANTELELKIRQFLEEKSSPSARDYSTYYVTIAELQEKIQESMKVNGDINLSICNAKLAADDFNLKYENEQAMRMSVDSDIAGLRRVLDELTMSRSDLEKQIEDLKEELIFLKKNHEENLMDTKAQISGQVNVEVDTPSQQDLTTCIEGMRSHYELLTDKNRKGWENWLQQKSEVLKNETVVNVEIVQTTKTELTDLKRTVQSLKIEQQSQLSTIAGLESTLDETQSSYSRQLMNFQQQVSMQEEKLLQLKNDIERQSHEYQVLLDMKTMLEMEIAQYRKLLGEDEGGADLSKDSSNTTTKQHVIIKQVMDVKVVS